MKKQIKTGIFSFALSLTVMFSLAGCGQKAAGNPTDTTVENARQAEGSAASENTAASQDADLPENAAVPESAVSDSSVADAAAALESDESGETVGTAELEVCFGDYGDPFILHLYENDTAAAIARHVGTASWRLPIYHYDDYDNWESMQYYDIPSRYEIPSDAETVTAAKGGEVYYSEPNRIVLFYHDAEISSEYTKVGYFDYTDEFVAAVENNPVLEGWDTKMINISMVD